jgi:hypothetical protein
VGGRPAPEGLTDDQHDLSEAARLHLREKFLRAKVAVSGANFAAVDTGTVVVVESEGNGRMCLTLPETLITVMGIGKVLPSCADLEVFLQLLPRSSTGERMNPYTSLWTGATEGDGPQAFHLVLLDNDRTATLADEVGRQALSCIRCSACLNGCPVYERTGCTRARRRAAPVSSTAPNSPLQKETRPERAQTPRGPLPRAGALVSLQDLRFPACLSAGGLTIEGVTTVDEMQAALSPDGTVPRGRRKGAARYEHGCWLSCAGRALAQGPRGRGTECP